MKIRSGLTWLRRLRLLHRGAEGLGSPRLIEAFIDCRRGYGAKGSGRITIGGDVWLERGVVLHAFGGHITVGESVFIGPYVVIYGHGGVGIGHASLISMHCRILSSNHAIPPIGVEIRSRPDEMRPTRIGRDVWLGAGVTVLGGVTIGDGCIVGAGAVVTQDLPPYSIALGIPARVAGRRPASPSSPS